MRKIMVILGVFLDDFGGFWGGFGHQISPKMEGLGPILGHFTMRLPVRARAKGPKRGTKKAKNSQKWAKLGDFRGPRGGKGPMRKLEILGLETGVK
jgi:hypothetical protein